jgi:hypothetical protein
MSLTEWTAGPLNVIVYGRLLEEPLTNTNVDVEVIDDRGLRWSATFFTLANLEHLFDKNAMTGECGRGLFLWAADMILVREISREVINRTIAELRASGEFETAFGPLDRES